MIPHGLHGGAQWPGGVFNPYTQNVYVQVNQIPWLLKLFVSSNRKPPENFKNNYELYIDNCSSCHQENREGIYITKDEKVISNNLIYCKAKQIKLGGYKIDEKDDVFASSDNIKVIYSNNEKKEFYGYEAINGAVTLFINEVK